ncbi:MAG: dTDP-glucose 4,6-dehydratase [Gammaproteobacteria bacterium]
MVTGGAGFIGSNFVLDWFLNHDEAIINIDKLTYAGNLSNLDVLKNNDKHIFIQADINARETIDELLNHYQPRAIVHFAAESHVDRSISAPDTFIKTNINGTFTLLEAARTYYDKTSEAFKKKFRFIHISTDEVYGSLSPSDPAFTETTAFAPNSPYSASKASSDHLVRAYFHTYGLPVITTNCSNNYGPYQFTEKLIPLMITNALQNKALPIYGDGQNVRDWLYVLDHCSAIREVLASGKPGETYNIGGNSEKTNIEVVTSICQILNELKPLANTSYEKLITFVDDRPGHDRRYAIDATKIKNELGWTPQESFTSGLRKTVKWYLDNIKI